MIKKQLTEKQRMFVLEYLVDMNATQAAIRAGYSSNSADRIGAELLGKTVVIEKIRELQTARANELKIDADNTTKELAAIAFSSVADVVDWGNDWVRIKPKASINQNVLKAIKELRVDRAGNIMVKMHDKLPALEQLGKHLGMFDVDKGKESKSTTSHVLERVRDILRKRAQSPT